MIVLLKNLKKALFYLSPCKNINKLEKKELKIKSIHNIKMPIVPYVLEKWSSYKVAENRVFTDCNHVFCRGCILEWVRSDNYWS